MASSSLRNMTPQSIARLCASSQIEFGEGIWREECRALFFVRLLEQWPAQTFHRKSRSGSVPRLSRWYFRQYLFGA